MVVHFASHSRLPCARGARRLLQPLAAPLFRPHCACGMLQPQGAAFVRPYQYPLKSCGFLARKLQGSIFALEKGKWRAKSAPHPEHRQVRERERAGPSPTQRFSTAEGPPREGRPLFHRERFISFCKQRFRHYCLEKTCWQDTFLLQKLQIVPARTGEV